MAGTIDQLRLGGSVELQQRLDARLAALTHEGVVPRIWQGDYTLWSDDPTEITEPSRLGWLTVADEMLPEVLRLGDFASAARRDGLKTAVLLGMGGSSLAPEVMYRTFGADSGLALRVLDTTVPAEIITLEKEVP